MGKPLAVEKFEIEKLTLFEGATFFLEHPIDRLKYHIQQTGGKILKSEFSVDGLASVVWEADGKRYTAWSTWPETDYQIKWKELG